MNDEFERERKRRTSLIPASTDHNSTMVLAAENIAARSLTILASLRAFCRRSKSACSSGDSSRLKLRSAVRVKPLAIPESVCSWMTATARASSGS
jgi:hypothetical protein